MALGLTIDGGSAPIQVGQLAKSDPILATASLMASGVLLKMAAYPRAKRLQEMEKLVNKPYPGLGTQARAQYVALAATKPASQSDQVMFDVVRSAIANRLVALTKAKMAQQGMSGLGSGLGTTQDVRDGFCTFAGTTSIIGGGLDAFGVSSQVQGGQVGALQSGSATGATIGGCNIASIDAQTRQAQAIGQLAQSTQLQTLQAQQHQEAMQFQYLLLGGGGLVVATILFAILRK